MNRSLRVVRAGGLATIQDLGWRIGRASGLPAGGAIDPAALRVGNVLVGNPDEAAGIEIALGNLIVEFTGPTRFALTGWHGPASLDDRPVTGWQVERAVSGQRLAIERPVGGRFGYLAIEGGVAVRPTLGSRSTYLPTALGGWHGRRLGADDELPIGPEATDGPPVGFGIEPATTPPDEPVRITSGPQNHLFPDRSFEQLVADRYQVTPASDRMGTRLAGAALEIRTKATLPSEATCLGALQVPDGGQPIAVLRDGPTVGGYPKIAVVIGADLARFSQIALGGSVRFSWVSVASAQLAGRRDAMILSARLTAIRQSR